ncbi:MAG: radical SAM protein [Phaeodactylibacter sp.]|uniref:radical SAM protein n=1 Tax=Phaeodactylibacter sp. TaxID=1940289 RepID=UPI0032EDFF69
MTDSIKISRQQSKKYQLTRPLGIEKRYCLAPKNSLYFSRNGSITACCYNKKYELGRYPADLPSAVWSSDRLAHLQRVFDSGQLISGCEGCAEQIEAGNVENTLAKNFDRYAEFPLKAFPIRLLKAGLRGSSVLWNQIKAEGRRIKYGTGLPTTDSKMPKLLEFELSNTCNLECAMCFGEFSSSIRRNREHLPALADVYDAKFVKDLDHFLPHIWEAKFYGGEPFLIPLYYEIWDKIRKCNPKAQIHITTNGSILNQKVRTVLKTLNIHLILSIDSFEPETYEAIRKNANFETVMSNLQYFNQVLQQKNRDLIISICPTILNAHEIPDMVERCNKNGWYLHFNTVWWPEDLSLRKLPKPWLNDLILQYRKAAGGRASQSNPLNQAKFSGLINQLISWRDAQNDD